MKRIFLLSMALIALVSCTEDIEQPVTATETGEGDEVLFRYTISDKGLLTRMTALSDPPMFEAGDMVGIYMIPHQSGGDPDLDHPYYLNPSSANVPYLYDPNNFDYDPVTPVPHPGPEPILVAAGGKIKYPSVAQVNFVSYWPYRAGIEEDKHRVPVSIPTTTNEYPLPDMGLLYANGVGIPKKKFEVMDLVYKSPLCKLTMIAEPEGSVDMTGARLTLKGVPTKAKFSLVNEEFSQWDGYDVKDPANEVILDYHQNVNTGKAEWETLIIPHKDVRGQQHTEAQSDTINGRIFTFTFGETPNEQTHTFYLPIDFEFESGENYVFTFNVLEPEPTEFRNDLSNCYMVKPGERVRFKLWRAYVNEGGSNTLHVDQIAAGTGPSYTDKFDAAVLWDDAEVISALVVKGAGPNTELTVITDPKKTPSGNAVVAIKKKDTNEIVWSYHIWVTDYDNIGTVSMAGDYVFMDRNLGATAGDLSLAAYGLLYQWGRKDPFPGTAPGAAGWPANCGISGNFNGIGEGVSVSKDNYADAIVESIENPTTFFAIISIDSNHDWLPTSNKYLWNTSDGDKTIYDPCPDGWRVPYTQTPWESAEIDRNNNITDHIWYPGQGLQLVVNSQSSYYPFTGERSYRHGRVSNKGRLGQLWLSEGVNDSATLLKIENLYFNIISWYKAIGFSVRCIQE